MHTISKKLFLEKFKTSEGVPTKSHSVKKVAISSSKNTMKATFYTALKGRVGGFQAINPSPIDQE